METQRGDGILGFYPYFDIRHNQDGRVVSSKLQPHFTPTEIPRYSFLLEAVWTPVLLNADSSDRPLENLQGPYLESNPEPP